ncbi:hypothetical protein CC80DRAFT_240626 [Byssothecium circinans]|uniref:Uncharacterized protein n=1 Tax=Byssothecium circinans TaxID=147558 RepID=A0A6A5TDK7_9PLEO|nr:hypothetical protein CC80DRAFT_240626 [Byssothecium circinans]
MTSRTRSRSSSARPVEPAFTTEEEITELILSHEYYQADAKRWKKACTKATQYALVLGLIVLFFIFKALSGITLFTPRQPLPGSNLAFGPIRHHEHTPSGVLMMPKPPTLTFNAPYLPRGEHKTSPSYGQGFANSQLLIAAKRPEMFFELPSLYTDEKTNLTLAHFGWALQSPYKALNFDPKYRNRILEKAVVANKTEREEVRGHLLRYVEEFLIPPWLPTSPMCNPSTASLFDPDICKYAVSRFRKQYKVFLSSPAGALME